MTKEAKLPTYAETIAEKMIGLVGSKDATEAMYGRLLATGTLEKILEWMDAEQKSNDPQYAVITVVLAQFVGMVFSNLMATIRKGKEDEIVTIWIELLRASLQQLADDKKKIMKEYTGDSEAFLNKLKAKPGA